MDSAQLSRRTLLKGSAAAVAMGTIGSIGALHSRQAWAAGDPVRLAPIPSPYGALSPVADETTGLPLLQLPPGFSYRSFAWSGDAMDDGQACPDRHDGMAVILANPGNGLGLSNGRGHGNGPELVLVRNHERSNTALINAPAMYDTGTTNGARAGGGTTTLRFRDGQWLGVEPSLGGTTVNCAGGRTPWGTWLTCEETRTNDVSSTGRRHGYVFEVHPDATRTTGRPLVGLGRFSHEAVAIDPQTGLMYLTEDDRNKSGLYRFVPNDRAGGGRFGSLENGGRLQAARVRGMPNADLTVADIGSEFALEWVDIPDPDLDALPAPGGFPDASGLLSGPFAQGWSEGALRMSRGEGIFYAHGKMFIVDTSTGRNALGEKGRGYGAVWVLDLATQRLRALFVSGDQAAAHNPDNIVVSPRGGVLLCEDPDAAPSNSPDQYGPGTRLVGLTQAGESYYFAKNNIALTASQIAGAGKTIAEGDYRDNEWCGACWSPDGRWLFVNIQTPGITVAITGPWLNGTI